MKATTLDEQAINVYLYAARQGIIPSIGAAAAELDLELHEVFAAITTLVELRLLRTDGANGHRLYPVYPEEAVASLISPIEREICQRRELIDRLRERIDNIARPAAAGGGIDQVEGIAEIRGLLKLTADVCQRELLVLRNSQGEAFDDLLDATNAVLDRDVSVRVLCPHRSRADFATRAKVKRLLEGGALIRTITHAPQAAVVFDRSVAVLFHLTDGEEPSARRVRDDKVVHFLVDLFDQLWDGGSTFTTDYGYDGEIVDDLQRSIARLMAQGLTDEVVARRLGMSVRTCRRHISDLLRNLDSVSRFQAGVQAAKLLAGAAQ